MQPFIHRGWHGHHPPLPMSLHIPPANAVSYCPPPSNSTRLRGALGLASRLERPTMDDKFTKPFRCDRQTQVDLRVPVTDAATEPCQCDKSTQVVFTVGLVSRGTDSFTEHKCVQTMPRTTVTADAFTIPFANEVATQTTRLVMVADVDIQTSPNESQETATQLVLSEIISPITFNRLARLVQRVSHSQRLSNTSKEFLMEAIHDLSLKANELNASFDHLQLLGLSDVIQESSSQMAQTKFSDAVKKIYTDEDIYMSDEEVSIENFEFQRTSSFSDARSSIPCSSGVPASECSNVTRNSLDINHQLSNMDPMLSACASIPYPIAMLPAASSCSNSTANSTEMNQLLSMDPVLTSQVMTLLVQRYPELVASSARLQIATYNELLCCHQLRREAAHEAHEARAIVPPGFSLRATAADIDSMTGKLTQPSHSKEEHDHFHAQQNVAWCHIPSPVKPSAAFNSISLKEDSKMKRTTNAPNSLNRGAPGTEYQPRSECKQQQKKSVNLTSYKPLHPDNAKDCIEERDRQLIQTTARSHKSTSSVLKTTNKPVVK